MTGGGVSPPVQTQIAHSGSHQHRTHRTLLSDALMSETTQPETPDRESQLDDLVDDFVRRRRSGEKITTDEVVAANPGLQPELSQRLEFALSLIEVISKTESEETTKLPANEQMARLRCPHCGNIVQVVSEDTETTCGGCGSNIDADEETTIVQRRTRAQIGHFQLVERVGSGGFGIVYRATDTNLKRTVALKVPRRGYFGSPDEEARFLREARHAATLRHPNIVQVFEVGTESGSHYIATEFIEGLDLAEVIRCQFLSFRETADLLSKIALGLHHAHEKNLIHRDVKPANIIVDRDYEPYLTDFGLARTEEPAITMTREGEILGTPAYMSPEQARGDHSALDRRSDVYSLGVTLFRMLSGELPFRGSRRMLLDKVIEEEPPQIRSLNDRVPRDLETIALHAMQKDPEKRYQTAKTFAEELQRWLSGDPIQARPISRTERLWRWCRKHPLVSSLTSTIAVLLIAMLTGAVIWGARESGLRQAASKSDQQSRLRLAQIFAATADELVEDDDNLAALPFSVEALSVLEGLGQPDRIESARTLIKTTLGLSPRLINAAAVAGPVRYIARRESEGGFLAATEKTIHQFAAGDWSSRSSEIVSAETVYRPAYNRDGTRIIASHGVNHATLWDSTSQQVVAALKHDGMVSSGVFSRDGTVCATTGGDGKTTVWSANDGTAQQTFDHGDAVMTSLTFSPDGKVLAVWSKAPTVSPNQLLLLSVDSGETSAIPLGRSLINELIFEDSGAVLAVARSGLISRYAVNGEAAEHFQLQGEPRTTHVRRVWDSTLVTVSPGGSWMWDTAGAGSLKIGPIQHGALVAPGGFGITPDGTILATAGGHDRVNLHWVLDGRRVGSALAHGTPVTALTFLSDQLLVTGTTNGSIKLWDVSGLTRDTAVLKHPGRVRAAVSSPDSSQVATVSIEAGDPNGIGRSHVWNRKSGQPIGEIVRHPAATVATAYSHDGRILASADFEGGIFIRHVNTPNAPPRKLADEAWVTHLAFPNQTNDYFASANSEGKVRIWREGSDQPSATFELSGHINGLQFHSTDDTLLAACSDGGSARVWNTESRQAESVLLEDAEAMLSCRFSPDGKTLATAGESGNVILWDWKKGVKVSTFPSFSRQRYVDFSSNGEWLAVANGLGLVQIWPASGAKQPSRSFPHPHVTTVDWHPTKQLVVSAGRQSGKFDRSHARLWDVDETRAISPKLPFADRAFATFLPDGKAVLAFSYDSTAVLWDITPTEMSTDSLRKLSSVLSGTAIREERAIALSAEEQVRLLQELRNEVPNEFVSVPEERKRWDTLRGIRTP